MTSLSDIQVLVIDDNAQMRLLVRSLLRAGRISKVFEASSAEEAFAVMQAQPFDLVILDWKMSPTDGLALARMLRWRDDSPNPFIPIIMLTAHTEASKVAAARDAGVNGFVKKPISARLLYDRVSSALTDTRLFIRSGNFRGPDRRRGPDANYAGPFRRASDGETIDVDDLKLRA